MHPFARGLWFLPLFFAASCSDHHVLAGTWSQELPGGAAGISLEFDAKGERIVVHTAPRPDGGHGHPKVSHTWDAATKTLTIKGDPLVDGSKVDTWSGKLDGDHLELSSAEGKLAFHKGGKPHGH